MNADSDTRVLTRTPQLLIYILISAVATVPILLIFGELRSLTILAITIVLLFLLWKERLILLPREGKALLEKAVAGWSKKQNVQLKEIELDFSDGESGRMYKATLEIKGADSSSFCLSSNIELEEVIKDVKQLKEAFPVPVVLSKTFADHKLGLDSLNSIL